MVNTESNIDDAEDHIFEKYNFHFLLEFTRSVCEIPEKISLHAWTGNTQRAHFSLKLTVLSWFSIIYSQTKTLYIFRGTSQKHFLRTNSLCISQTLLCTFEPRLSWLQRTTPENLTVILRVEVPSPIEDVVLLGRCMIKATKYTDEAVVQRK